MREIYQTAKRVLMWLGKERDASSLGLQHARELYRRYFQKGESKPEKFHFSKAYEVFRSVYDGRWQALFDIIDREYFGRAWIIQEVFMAKDAVVVCGNQTISWLHLVSPVMRSFTSDTWVFEFYGSSNRAWTVMSILSSMGDILQGQQMGHTEILARYRAQNASDDRDKIFAFYGFSAQQSLQAIDIHPNYNITTRQLYVDLAASTLQSSSNLDFLSMPRLPRKGVALELPSWAPDWGTDEVQGFSLLQLELSSYSGLIKPPSFCASQDSTYVPVIDDGKRELYLLGYSVDRVARMGLMWDLQERARTIVSQALFLQRNQVLINDWENVIGPSSESEYPTGEKLLEVVWQTLVAGYHFDSKAETRKLWVDFEKRQRYWRLLFKLKLHNFLWVWIIAVILGYVLIFLGIPNPEMKFRARVHALISRRIVRTDKGYIGLVPGISEVGDYIVLFKGGKLPFIVRPRGLGWELIGDCYMHGLSHGEAWDERKCIDFCIT